VSSQSNTQRRGKCGHAGQGWHTPRTAMWRASPCREDLAFSSPGPVLGVGGRSCVHDHREDPVMFRARKAGSPSVDGRIRRFASGPSGLCGVLGTGDAACAHDGRGVQGPALESVRARSLDKPRSAPPFSASGCRMKHGLCLAQKKNNRPPICWQQRRQPGRLVACWGEEWPLAEAKRSNRPILLSVGIAALPIVPRMGARKLRNFARRGGR